ncbi:MAG TPA: carboxypeptidase-like regulatory domain-containing protein [Candidatus Cloacimonadota bacterium]|nr:carboxypeptidase-like regulatory domain-containing protein [Candidatus Cloacimonadota bacterium]HPT71821.1 carboxypeptidase-like regulatory domain-containing protein [Candidatus Cloacimonadota bacterium]
MLKLSFSLILCFLALHLFSQNVYSISGTFTDDKGKWIGPGHIEIVKYGNYTSATYRLEDGTYSYSTPIKSMDVKKLHTTFKDGQYKISDLPAGWFIFKFSKQGYKSIITDKIYIPAYQGQIPNIKMQHLIAGELTGKVTDCENRPLAYVNVTIPELQIGSQTDSKGKYTITEIPIGTHDFQFLAIGYEKQIIPIEIKHNQIKRIDIQMKQRGVIIR